MSARSSSKIALHLLEGLRLGGRLRPDGHPAERDAVPLDEPTQVLVVGDHARHLALELAGPPAVQEVRDAVVLLAGEEHDALGDLGVAEVPPHVELGGDRLERRRQLPGPKPSGSEPATISIRRKNRPESRSPCCAASSTDPPRPAMSPVTAATIPIRSGQVTVRM